MPVTARNASAAGDAGSISRNAALAIAPTSAEAAKSRRGSSRSARPSRALTMQPTTKPTCTALVRAACMNAERRNSVTSAGSTAEAENQSDIAATWHRAITVIENPFDRAALPVTITPPPPFGGPSAPARIVAQSLSSAKRSHGPQPVQPPDASGAHVHGEILRAGEMNPQSREGVARHGDGQEGRRQPHVQRADRPRGHPAAGA